MSSNRSKLSPMPYIRNNRVRTTVLIISLSMFMLMIYAVDFIVGGMDEPFYQCDVAPLEKICIVVPDMVVENAEEMTDEEFLTTYWSMARDLCAKIPRSEEILDAKPYARQSVLFNSVIGSSYDDCYLFETAKDCEDFLSHMDAKLTSGRMPQEPGEILVEQKLIDNHKNDNTLLQNMGSEYHVVGVVESDYYLAFGIADPGENNIWTMLFLKEGSNPDINQVYEAAGSGVDYLFDKASADKSNKEAMGSMDTVQTLFVSVSGSLLLICVAVVLSLHIMDRHNEWCLLNSIGFSTGEIYLMALKEILICIGISILAGSVLMILTAKCLAVFLYQPIGAYVNVWRPDAIPRILAVFLVLIGIIQIPLFTGMHKIQTIDTIES